MSIFLIIQFTLTAVITILVMIQKSSSIGLGAYNSSNESVFGAKGPTNFLVKATYTMGFLFVLNTLALGYYYNKSHTKSVIDNIEIPAGEQPSNMEAPKMGNEQEGNDNSAPEPMSKPQDNAPAPIETTPSQNQKTNK